MQVKYTKKTVSRKGSLQVGYDNNSHVNQNGAFPDYNDNRDKLEDVGGLDVMDNQDRCTKEWIMIAYVLDRCFLILYCLLFVIFACVVFVKVN